MVEGVRNVGMGELVGDPTRAICSTLIAQAFQAIRYPILPLIDLLDLNAPDCPKCVSEILRVRHHSLLAPRDFDVSPYFDIIKPTLETGFDFHALSWAETGETQQAQGPLTSAPPPPR